MNTFICFTPYHLFLTQALISEKGLSNFLIIFFRDSECDRSLEFFKKKYSHQFQVQNGVYSKSHWLARLSILVTTFKLKNRYKTLRISSLYLFNDYRPESQFFLAHVRKTLTAKTYSNINYVEDGYSCYLKGSLRKKSVLYKSFINALFPWFNPELKWHGLACNYDKYYFTQPNLTRSDYPYHRKYKIGTKALRCIGNIEWSEVFSNISFPENSSFYFFPLCLTLEQKSQAENDFSKELEKNNNSIFYIKHHNRQEQAFCPNDLKAKVLDKEITAELIFLKAKSIDKVYASYSTVSLSFTNLLAEMNEVELRIIPQVG